MRIQIQDRLDGQASAGELERTVLGDLEQQFARYVEVVADHAKVIEETNEKNQVLSGKVMDIMAGIQFQDITRQKIEQVIKSLSLLKEQFEQTVMNSFEFATPESEKDLTVDTLFDSYVMNDQRVTHLKTLGNVQDNVIEERSLPTIELF
jgi:methyl-accepting chemotaxis protein